MKIATVLFSFTALMAYNAPASSSHTLDKATEQTPGKERRLTIGEFRQHAPQAPATSFAATQPSLSDQKSKRLSIGMSRQDPYAQLRDPSQPHGLNLNHVHSMQKEKRKAGMGDHITTTIMLYQQGKHRLEELAKQPGSEKKVQALKSVTDKQVQKIQATLGLTPAQVAAIPAWVPQ